MPIPTKGFYDPPEAPTDSVTAAQQRRARMEKEAVELLKAKQEAEERRLERERKHNEEARRQEDEYVMSQSSGETREHLLARILAMRDQDKPEPPKPVGRTPEQQRIYELQQEEGRRCVALAEAKLKANLEAKLKREREEAAQQAHTVPVVHPNPTMDEQFPATKATLGKTRK